MTLHVHPSRPYRRLLTLGVLLVALALGGALMGGCAPDNKRFVQDIQDQLRAPDKTTPRALVERVRSYLEMDNVRVAPQVVRAILILSGLVLLVAGWRIYRGVIALPGLILGALIGARFGASESSELVALLGLVIGAGLGGLLALIFHDVMVFGLGAYFGAALALDLIGWNPTLMIILGGLIGGVLFVALFYWLLFAMTAMIGALLLGGALGLSPAVMALLAAVGLIMQYNLARILGDRPRLGRARKPSEPTNDAATSA
ncbi:MAG: hypothetical protein GX613_10130 [Chloroflexi bacterium]|jgi:hypothetical protein|nr:hypothetical protein [Chloroflexota bacterium]